MRSLPSSFSLLITEQFKNSLEAFARICVNGFLFGPTVYIFRSSSLPLQSDSFATTTGASYPAGVTGNRGGSITQRFRKSQKSIQGPFELATRAPPTVSSNHSQTHHRDTSITFQPAHRAHATNQQNSEPSFLSRVLRSDAHGTGNSSHQKADAVSLPFRLNMSNFHSKTQRNVPYLQQNWAQIDFLAVVSFWITYALATTGYEHGNGGLHVGVFRAISVIRIGRLLLITPGTTVSFFFLGG